jgi:tetrahydromethanopterin S-methyltransferase subunit H
LSGGNCLSARRNRKDQLLTPQITSQINLKIDKETYEIQSNHRGEQRNKNMFRYKAEQKSFKIGDYMIGGDPRSTPTAMFGTIFYSKQKFIFKDEQNGIIDRNYAETLIKKQEELADKTGLVPGLDVVLSYEHSIKPLLDFVIETTDAPILVDAPTFDLKLPTLNYVRQAGIQNRIIHNSLTPDSKREEFELLHDSRIENFVLLAMETSKWTTQARIDVIDKMIKDAHAARFSRDNFLIDGCVLDFTSLGLAMSAMRETKNTYGFPVGCGAHNAVDTWRNLRSKFGDIKQTASVVASTITLATGADFVLYGPIQQAEIMFPSVAFVKAALSQLLFDEGKMPPPNHPVFKIG